MAKKIYKKKNRWLAFGLSMFFVGVFLFLLGMTLIGWDFNRLDSLTYTPQTLDLSNEVFNGMTPTEFDITLDDFDVEVKRGDEFRFEYFVTEDSNVSYSFENGKLIFINDEQVSTINPTEFFSAITNNNFRGIARSAHKYILTLSSDTNIKLAMKNGSIYFDGSFADIDLSLNNARVFLYANANNLMLSSKNSEIYLNGNFKNIEVENNNGNTHFSGTADSLRINSKNANIYMTNVDVLGGVELSQNNGWVAGYNINMLSLKADIDNANMYLEKSSISDWFELTAENGGLTFEGLNKIPTISFDLDDFNVNGDRLSGDEMTAYVDNSSLKFEIDIKRTTIEGKNSNVRLTALKSSLSYIKVTGNNSTFRAYDEHDERCDDGFEYGTVSTESFLIVKGNNNSVRVWLVKDFSETP